MKTDTLLNLYQSYTLTKVSELNKQSYHILDIFDYICAQNAQCWARITKSDMEIQRYNRLKAANEREQNEVHFNSAEREQARTQFKIILAEKELARGSQSRWATASVLFTLDDK